MNKKLTEMKSEFKKMENMILSVFKNDLNVQELVRNRAFITNILRNESLSQFDTSMELLFEDRKSLDEFKEMVEFNDFGGDHVIKVLNNGKRSIRRKFYDLYFDNEGSYKISVNLHRTYKSKKFNKSYYVLNDGTFLIDFN